MADDPKQEKSIAPEAELCVAGSQFDVETYRNKVLSDPKSREAIETFLRERHGEWESKCDSRLQSSPER
jgi:hypothetical protein